MRKSSPDELGWTYIARRSSSFQEMRLCSNFSCRLRAYSSLWQLEMPASAHSIVQHGRFYDVVRIRTHHIEILAAGAQDTLFEVLEQHG